MVTINFVNFNDIHIKMLFFKIGLKVCIYTSYVQPYWIQSSASAERQIKKTQH